MPYILGEKRKELSSGHTVPVNAGELNYLITELCLDYLNGHKSYVGYNEVVGVLECAKLEFYRRVVSPYEDLKKNENGDIY